MFHHLFCRGATDMVRETKVWFTPCRTMIKKMAATCDITTKASNQTKILSPEWIQNGTAIWTRTSDRIIHYWRKIWSVLQRCIQATEWDHHACCLQTARWPHIPAKSNSISVLVLLYKFLIRRHTVLIWNQKIQSYRRSLHYFKKQNTAIWVYFTYVHLYTVIGYLYSSLL